MQKLHAGLKPISQLHDDQERVCVAPDCKHPVTMFRGVGQELCDEHRGMLKEYGGLATLNKPYSFQRVYVCSCCNTDVRIAAARTYQLQYPQGDWELVPEEIKNETYRTLMDVDHVDGNSDNNDPANTVSLCKNCHGVKTVLKRNSVNRRYTR